MIGSLIRRLGFGRVPPGPTAPDTPFDPENPDNWLSLDYVHDRVIAQLESRSELWDVVDSRLRLILGFIGIVFAAVLGLQRGAAPLPFRAGLLAIAAVIIYIAAGLIVARFYWPTTFDRPPEPAALRTEYLTTDSRVTKLETIDFVLLAYTY